jgi:hypothetical protein
MVRGCTDIWVRFHITFVTSKGGTGMWVRIHLTFVTRKGGTMVRFGYGPFWLWDETSGSGTHIPVPPLLVTNVRWNRTQKITNQGK